MLLPGLQKGYGARGQLVACRLRRLRPAHRQQLDQATDAKVDVHVVVIAVGELLELDIVICVGQLTGTASDKVIPYCGSIQGSACAPHLVQSRS